MGYSSKKFDIVVFGFGLVSKLFLYSISNLNLKVAVINRQRDYNFRSNTKRGIALNLSSCKYLENIGMSNLLNLYSNKINQILISEKNSKYHINLRTQDINRKFLSKLIEESYLEKFFLEKLKYEKIYFFNNYVIDKMKKIKNGWNIALKKEYKDSYIKIDTNLFVGIDGSNSFSRRILNIKKYVYDYKNSAIVMNCNVK